MNIQFLYLSLIILFGCAYATNKTTTVSLSKISPYTSKLNNHPFNSSVGIIRNYLKEYGRDLKSYSFVSLLTPGNLAAVGLGILSGLAFVSPIFYNDFRRRDEKYKLTPVHPGLSQKLYESLLDLSSEAVPFIENEILQAHNYYKRSKRGGDERLTLHDFVSSRFISFSENIMVWVEKSLDNLPHLPRLEAQACMKRAICEAHNQPKKYGLSGLVLQLFFPPYIESDTPSKIISKYQLAARYGRTENANCAVQYDDCIVNFLDLVQSVTNLIM